MVLQESGKWKGSGLGIQVYSHTAFYPSSTPRPVLAGADTHLVHNHIKTWILSPGMCICTEVEHLHPQVQPAKIQALNKEVNDCPHIQDLIEGKLAEPEPRVDLSLILFCHLVVFSISRTTFACRNPSSSPTTAPSLYLNDVSLA